MNAGNTFKLKVQKFNGLIFNWKQCDQFKLSTGRAYFSKTGTVLKVSINISKVGKVKFLTVLITGQVT